MSCLGITLDKIQQWFQRLKKYFQTDHVQVEIVRQILKQVLVSVDQVYGADPVPMDKIKEQLDKYIDQKVDEKITEILEFCRLSAEAKLNAPEQTTSQSSACPSASVHSVDGSASVHSTGVSASVHSADRSASVHSSDGSDSVQSGSGSFQDCYSNMEEIPLDDVSVEVQDDGNKETEAPKKKKKSLVKRIFKKRSNQSDAGAIRTEKKKPFLFRKIFKRLPIV